MIFSVAIHGISAGVKSLKRAVKKRRVKRSAGVANHEFNEVSIESTASVGAIHSHTVETSRLNQEAQQTITLYSKFLARSIASQPNRSWDWVDVDLPRVVAVSNHTNIVLSCVFALAATREAYVQALESILRQVADVEGITVGFVETADIQIMILDHGWYTSPQVEHADDFINAMVEFHVHVVENRRLLQTRRHLNH